MTLFDRQSMNDIFGMADDLADRDIGMLRERIPENVIGMQQVSDAEFARFYVQQLEADTHLLQTVINPETGQPEDRRVPGIPRITMPDGTIVLASPMAMALRVADGGKELTRKFERVTGRNNGV